MYIRSAGVWISYIHFMTFKIVKKKKKDGDGTKYKVKSIPNFFGNEMKRYVNIGDLGSGHIPTILLYSDGR